MFGIFGFCLCLFLFCFCFHFGGVVCFFAFFVGVFLVGGLGFFWVGFSVSFMWVFLFPSLLYFFQQPSVVLAPVPWDLSRRHPGRTQDR